MKKKKNNIIFWFLSILYLEMVLRLTLFDNFSNINIINLILFLIPIVLIMHLISSIFNKKMSRFISLIMIAFLTLVFIAQIIYYKIYLSVFSIYSIGSGTGQVLEFMSTIIMVLKENIIPILFMLIPLAIFIIFSKSIVVSSKRNPRNIVLTLIFILLFQGVAIGSLFIKKNENYSAKQLYYDTHSPTLSVNKLGLLTTMRIDFKRLMFGFEEESKFVDNLDPADDDEDNIEEPKEYNKIDIDFDKLISKENDKSIKDMHEYFKRAEATSKNQYTGMFKGKNLIVFLAEAFYPIAIDKELTPTLYKLSNEGFIFKNFYTPIYPVSTSDGEYITVTSLLPKEGVWSASRSSTNYFPFVLGNSFKKIGYKTTAYHNHSATYYDRDKSHPNFGYDFYACKRGLNINCKIWPESDLEMIDATYKSYIENDPFLTYYVTVSGHLNYTKSGNMMAYKNWSYVKNMNYSDPVKAYMACHIELEKALSNLIKYLTIEGKLEDTVIAISSDHYPYGLTLDQINEKSSYVKDDNFEKHRNSFILWNSEMKPVKIDKIGSSLDVLPTLLNLFGIEYDSRLLMGTDLLSDSDPLVIYSNRSFITDKGRYNSITGKFQKADGATISDDYVKQINNKIYDKFYLSRKILETDYYRKVFSN